jgi:hypothetical protein
MPESLQDALAAVLADGAVPCLFRFSASAFDQEEYDQLGVDYDRAVEALWRVFGPPLKDPPPIVEPIDLEKVTCWQRSAGMVFVLLWWGDNTRVRLLEVGIAAPGNLFGQSG